MGYYTEDGLHHFLQFVPLAVNGWYMVATVPAKHVEEQAAQVAKLSLILFGVVFAVFYLLLFFIMRLREDSNRQLFMTAFVDSLTGADNFNRMCEQFDNKLDDLYHQASLVIFDINKFKVINDLHGYERGNEVLRRVAQVLQRELAPEESFCRLSADNFILLLKYEERPAFLKRLKALATQLKRDCTLEDSRMMLDIAFGVYEITEDIPFYIMLDRGAEALVRWNHDGHMVRPDEFIPLFERNGFILKLDMFILEEVARVLASWRDNNKPVVPLAVNFSRLHLNDSRFIPQMRRIMAQYNVPTSLVEAEITESVIFNNLERAQEVIGGLHLYGFPVSMDDFGSGYSSLNSLKDMPLDVLKLDAEFFRGEAADTERGELVVSEAIRLAKNLDMRTVAEGVEVKEQVEFLASQGCDMIQGYYFAKPMPHDEYEERIRKGRSDGKDEESLNSAQLSRASRSKR